MSDLILSIEDAMILIGGRPFFEGMTFHIHKGRKIALVGKNGAGKTTLMNMITGERELDDGRRWLAAGITIGHMEQNIAPVPGQTVREYVFSGINHAAADWDQSYKVDLIITPLGLRAEDRMDMLSGGLLRRATLARALVEEPDILLLDEPTNHMDLESIQWLENYLKYYPGAVLCVSHDRAFLSAITENVFWLDRGKLKISPRGFASFEEWSQELFGQEARQLQNRAKKVEMEMEWASRGVKARVKRNVRRVALAYEARSELERDQKSFRRATSKIKITAPDVEETSLNVAEFINVHKSFGDKEILNKFSLRIRRGERIGLLGKNGSGKTTFLKILIGEEMPDAGKVKMAKNLTFGYFDQKRSTLDPDQTLQSNLCPEDSDHLDVRGKSRHVCGYLKDFLFEPEDAWRKVKTLSGGQMNRLMLAKVLANPGSFLILDEPTNDLDMDTLDMLEEILSAYEGTLFVVSHDRDFLDQVVDKLLVFEGDGKIELIIGGYSDYIAFKKGREQEGIPKAGASSAPKARENAREQPVEPKKLSRMSYKLEHELQKLPEKIRELEKECAAIEEKMSDPDFYMKDPESFDRVSQRFPIAKAALEKAELRWLELEEMRQKLSGSPAEN
ncbi:MAG: ABC-F family ATP-binding cassette domain-containing protein [Alphaproteobacteria bacterium]|nr:ABC-F family ATP-binding cassette domain-containing protein [Alphaproteobacteria bacterium]